MEEKVLDAFGNELNHGDTVMLTKPLKVKWTKLNLKKWTVVKNIRLCWHDEEIECVIEWVKWIILRTEFLKKK